MSGWRAGYEGHEKISTRILKRGWPKGRPRRKGKKATKAQYRFVGGAGRARYCMPCDLSFPGMAELEAHQADKHGVRFVRPDLHRTSV